MKVNITDLLDDYTPDQELVSLENDNKSINLNTVKRNVSKRIARSKGGQLMHFNLRNRVAAACIAGITVLTLGGITVNAATNGAFLRNVKVFLIHEDGTKEEIQANIVITDEDGNRITEYLAGDQSGNDGASETSDPDLKDTGIDLEKYKNYAAGTYEEANSDGIVYEIVVAEDGSVSVKNKE